MDVILGLEIYRIRKTRTLSSQVRSPGTENCRIGTSLCQWDVWRHTVLPRVSAQLAFTYPNQAFSWQCESQKLGIQLNFETQIN